MDLKVYQKLCAESKILWTQHCLQRMQERNISRADVKNGIVTGEIIEDYPDDYPKEGEEITVTGIFDIYEEDGFKYCQLINASMEQ